MTLVKRVRVYDSSNREYVNAPFRTLHHYERYIRGTSPELTTFAGTASQTETAVAQIEIPFRINNNDKTAHEGAIPVPINSQTFIEIDWGSISEFESN